MQNSISKQTERSAKPAFTKGLVFAPVGALYAPFVMKRKKIMKALVYNGPGS